MPSENVTSSISEFRYQRDRIRVGCVYHYTKSDIDGSNHLYEV